MHCLEERFFAPVTLFNWDFFPLCAPHVLKSLLQTFIHTISIVLETQPWQTLGRRKSGKDGAQSSEIIRIRPWSKGQEVGIYKERLMFLIARFRWPELNCAFQLNIILWSSRQTAGQSKQRLHRMRFGWSFAHINSQWNGIDQHVRELKAKQAISPGFDS